MHDTMSEKSMHLKIAAINLNLPEKKPCEWRVAAYGQDRTVQRIFQWFNKIAEYINLFYFIVGNYKLNCLKIELNYVLGKHVSIAGYLSRANMAILG